MHALEASTYLASLILISITPRSAALPSSWAVTGWIGVLAKARVAAAAPASDRGRRSERCTGIEALKLQFMML